MQNKELFSFMTQFNNVNINEESPTSVLYRIINDMYQIPVCPVCGKPLMFNRFSKGFHMFCSNECKQSAKGKTIVYGKITNIMLEKYGVTSPAMLPEVKQKMKETNIKRYGVETPSQLKEFRDKAKKTSLQKYGTESPIQCDIVKKKRERTNIQKYGVAHTLQVKDIQDKIKETNLQRYGSENVFGSKQIQDKIKETNLERYGSEHYVTSNDMKEKQQIFRDNVSNEFIQQMTEHRKQTCLEKYNVTTNLMLPEIKEKANSEEAMNKSWETKKRNGTTNTSKIENEFFTYLLTIYNEHDIQRNYNKDERYQYPCDFYITPLDLFVEIQGHQGHGGHPFNKDDEQDIIKLNKWERKVSDNHPQYSMYIKNWTIRDVEKRNTAISNNLNYLEIFTCKIDNAIIALNKYIEENKNYNCFIFDK